MFVGYSSDDLFQNDCRFFEGQKSSISDSYYNNSFSFPLNSSRAIEYKYSRYFLELYGAANVALIYLRFISKNITHKTKK